ncbi:hypothetical protein [Flavihumibacter fluvii]|uniref:hypothetical protein n=1 Tax=Flavihumibacter fluvii TaxID=2838157 RepID=UPI001BDEAF7B|nr:hypothetical protein [Flavihumibacter fluvii]ULQ50911.1 hypothetical protein KJS93_12535 [Flavihumibacter fluvii]
MTTTILSSYAPLPGRLNCISNLIKVAREQRLHFSKLDDMGNYVLAIDTDQRKLVYQKNGSDSSSCTIIDLQDLKECIVKKQYNSIHAGELNKRRLSDFLRGLFLHLRFRNESPTVTIPLFEGQKDRQDDLEQLEEKAKVWERIVSKLLPKKNHVKVQQDAELLP